MLVLHNPSELIERLKINIGDQVLVYKAGEIIPKIKSLPTNSTGGFSQADFELELKRQYPGGKFIICPQSDILTYRVDPLADQPEIVNNILLQLLVGHYCSRQAVDIRGFGDETAKELVDQKLITNLADIYNLDRQDLLKLDGFCRIVG